LDQLAAVSEKPTEESLMSALSDLNALESGGGGNDAETMEAMSILNDVAAQPSKAELNAALSDLTGLIPSSAEMDEALASLDSIAAGSGKSKEPEPVSVDDLSAALLAVESHPDQADVDALNMLDSVAQTKLHKDQPQSLDADALSSALAGLDGLEGNDGTTDDLSTIDDKSLSAICDSLAMLDEDAAPVEDKGTPSGSNGIDFSALDAAAGNAAGSDSSKPLANSVMFDLSGLDFGDFSQPEAETEETRRPIANSAVFDLSGLEDLM